jgi:hypothetical protein
MPSFAESVAKLYRNAYERGEHFCNNYPNKEIHDPEWIRRKSSDPFFTWIIVTDGKNLIGSETLYETSDKISSDETLIAPEYRGRGLLPALFDFVFGQVQNKFSNHIVGGEIVFSPLTSSMRRITQGKYKWKSLGILPNKYLGQDGKRSSSLPAYYYPPVPSVQDQISKVEEVRIIEPVLRLYEIVQSQLKLPNPKEIIPVPKIRERDSKEYVEVLVDLNVPEVQMDLYRDGFKPVAIIPERNKIVMARFPLDGISLESSSFDFIFKENYQPNKELVNLIYSMV